MPYRMFDTELIQAVKYTVLTVMSAVFGLVTWEGFIATLQPISYMFTIGAGFMAMRHWYYATKKTRENDKPKS